MSSFDLYLNMESSGLTVPVRGTIHFNIQNFYTDIANCLSSHLVEIVRMTWHVLLGHDLRWCIMSL